MGDIGNSKKCNQKNACGSSELECSSGDSVQLERGAVTNEIDGRRERLELCPSRNVIFCVGSAGKRTEFRRWI